ncbi:queuosine precursor transporter [Escherichia coli]
MAGIGDRPLQPVCRRIATASFMAYALGQILTCTFLTACVKVAAGGWHRQRPHCSVTSVTVGLFFIAFWRSPDVFMAIHWMEIALVDYCFKVLISIVLFLPMYRVLLNMLLKRLTDKSEINALQAS